MGNIDNLNFKIILDDAEFNAKVKSDLDLAKAFNVEVSKLLDIRAEAASVEKKSAEATKEVSAATKAAAEATETHTERIMRRTKEMKSGNEEANRQSTLMRSLQGAVGAYFSIDGARRFVTELSRITGEFEKQQVALRAILQDTNGADVIFEKIKNLAVVSPFSVLDLTSFAKQLSAFSVPLDEIYDTTKMLADVSAGLGVDMSRVVLAYGQIRSASFLRGTELRQLTEAGIPILDELAKQFETLEGHAVSVGEVFNRISARQVPFEMVEKAFKDMTSEGGKFYEMQEVLSETLAGKISNLRDSYEIMMSSIGNANSGVLKGAIDRLTKMMSNYEQIGKDLVALAGAYGIYKLGVYGASLYTQGFVRTNLTLLKTLRNIWTAMAANPYSWIAGAVAAVAFGIYKIVTAESDFVKAQKSLNKTIDDFRTSSSGEISNLDYLWSQLKKASVGTREYDEARKRLMNTYGQYLTDIDKEALAVGNLAGVYDRLKDSIMGAEREKAVSEGLSNIAKSQADRMESVYRAFSELTKDADKGVKAQLQDYIKGRIKYSDMSEAAKKLYDKSVRYDNQTIISGTGFTMTFNTGQSNAFDNLRDSISKVNAESEELRNNLIDTLGFVYGVNRGDAPELQGFEKRVKAVLDKFADVQGLQSLSTTGKDYWTYIDDMRKFYAENVKKLKDAGGLEEGDKVVQNIRKQNEVISQIFSEAFGGKVSLADIKTQGKEAKEKAIENKIRLVKEMAAQYAKMKDAGIGDKSIRDKFDSVYDESDRGLYSTFDFERTLAALEAQLVKAGSSAAEQAKAMFRTKEIDSFTKAFRESAKALEEWLGFYDEINENTPESSTDSFGARVQRILNKLNAANYKDSQSAGKALTNLAEGESAYVEKMGREAWDKYADAGLEAIDRWTEAAKQANVDVAQQSLMSLGKSYLDTFFSSQGINMNDLGDKSFGQLQDMLDKLNKADVDGLIPEDVVERAKSLGVNIQPLLEYIKQSINAKKQDIFGAMFKDINAKANAFTASLNDVESTLRKIKELKNAIEFKKSFNMSTTDDEINLNSQSELLKLQLKSPYLYMEGISKAAGTAAKYMKEFAQATGDVNLEGIADALSAVSQNLSAAAQGGATGGWIGAVVAGVTDALGQITSAIIEEKAAVVKTAEAMKELREQLYLTRFQVDEDAYDTIFGTRVIAKASEAYRKAGAAISEYRKAVTAAMQRPPEEAAYDTPSTALSKKYLAQLEAYKKGYTALEGMIVMTKHRSAFGKSFGKNRDNDYAALKDLVPELFEGGEFNLENARTFLENKNAIRYWDKYNKGVVEAIEHIVELGDAYDKAMSILDDQISNNFSNMATELTDIIFDSVINGGDAWDQFREKGSEAILELGKQLMQEMMITEYLEPYKEQLRNAYKESSIKDTQEHLREITKNMYGGLMELIPMLQESAGEWINWMKNAGFDPTASGNSLSDGIKSITENTANLLASYVNAIRSDVAQIRALQTGMTTTMASLLEVLPKAPTLADYLTKIEAHTANIASDTSAILKQIRSVITTQGGNTALAVYM